MESKFAIIDVSSYITYITATSFNLKNSHVAKQSAWVIDYNHQKNQLQSYEQARKQRDQQ